MSTADPRPIATQASTPVLLTGAWRRHALARIFARWPSDGTDAADRLLELHPEPLDLSALYGTLGAGSGSGMIRQAALAMPAAGRTANMYLTPIGEADPVEIPRLVKELASCIRSAVIHVAGWHENRIAGARISLVQALVDEAHRDHAKALQDAGFARLSTLHYLNTPLKADDHHASAVIWPDGVAVRRIRNIDQGSTDRSLLLAAMEGSYEGTLDCPALCGIRSTEEVLDSHLAVGEFDPLLWWLVLRHHEPLGCMLLSRCPDMQTVELVYLGLAPALRGQGLGSRLIDLAMRELSRDDGETLSCAVDATNTPAIKLYERAGFTRYATRIAFIQDTKDLK